MNFLINTITAWDEPPRCRHQVASELAKQHHVVFIERNKSGTPGIEVVHQGNNFIRLIPHWPVDHRFRYRLPILNEFYQEFLFSRIKNFPSFEGFENWEIINFDFTATKLFKHFYQNRITYYCNDEHVGNAKRSFFLIDHYHKYIENIIVSNSKLCIATSNYLYNKLQKVNQNTYLITLGAPDDIKANFKVFTNEDKNKRKIRVAYVGYMLSHKLAVDWVLECSHNRRIEILLIGPENRAVKRRLAGKGNINFMGVKTGHDLYSTLASVNVCICPYDVNKINPGTTPNKLMLYLSLGKPTVITNIPNIESWKSDDRIIYTADKKVQFAQLIEKAFSDDTYSLFEKRLKIAEGNTWTQKIGQLISTLHSQSSKNYK